MKPPKKQSNQFCLFSPFPTLPLFNKKNPEQMLSPQKTGDAEAISAPFITNERKREKDKQLSSADASEVFYEVGIKKTTSDGKKHLMWV